MEKKTKVKLDKLTSRFFIYTHCKRQQYVANESLDNNTIIVCATCNLPIIVKDTDNKWYYVGKRVF